MAHVTPSIKFEVLSASLTVRDPHTGQVYELAAENFEPGKSTVELTQTFNYPDLSPLDPLAWRGPSVLTSVLLQGVITRNERDGVLFVLKKEDPDVA